MMSVQRCIMLASFTFVTIIALIASAGDDHGSQCSHFEFESVRAACMKDGEKEIKRLMRDVVKTARKDGKGWKCSTCHTNSKTHERKEKATQLLSEYLH